MMDMQAMRREVYEWAVSKGWEPDPDRTFGDECALLHSEVSEALEAYRDYRFADVADTVTGKPEGVGSELADVLIRLLHYCEVRGFTLDIGRPLPEPYEGMTFGDECTLMHLTITGAFIGHTEGQYAIAEQNLSNLYTRLVMSCAMHGLDLASEYQRKMAYNATRAHRHGGRCL